MYGDVHPDGPIRPSRVPAERAARTMVVVGGHSRRLGRLFWSGSEGRQYELVSAAQQRSTAGEMACRVRVSSIARPESLSR